MDTKGFPKPINDTQRRFKELCEAGGGPKGGPPRGKVQQLLKENGQELNKIAYKEIGDHLRAYPDANPWHVCFAMGLSWGHLAKVDLDFTGAAVRLLQSWNATDLKTARQFFLDRGPDPIQQSLAGGRVLFEKVKLPDGLPTELRRIGAAQQRWLTPILSRDRPPYIGSWNATAMFMVALFAQPSLAATLQTAEVLLPPGGPIYAGLQLLHRTHFLSTRPAGSELDDQAFEPGALYENNGLLVEVLRGMSDWSLIDVHSGLYMLGTRYLRSDHWF